MPDDESKPRRVSLGFHAGGAMPLRLAPDELETLRRELSNGAEGWYQLQTEDGDVLVNLGQVIYLRVESGEHRIGF